MEHIYYTSIETPVGILQLAADENFLLSVTFGKEQADSPLPLPEIVQEATQQLQAYFTGHCFRFSVPIRPSGSDFQKKVWQLVLQVPFGETASYLDIARQLGSEKYTRAVGLANGKNPLPILVPCHRIIGSGGQLTGYAGGIDRKRWLLRHESELRPRTGRLF